MVVDNLFSVIHAVVADLDGTAIKDFSKFVVFREEALFLSLSGREFVKYMSLYMTYLQES